jgi:hypothetical protein
MRKIGRLGSVGPPFATLPRLGSRVRIPSPAPNFLKETNCLEWPCGPFSASPPPTPKLGKHGGSSGERNAGHSRTCTAWKTALKSAAPHFGRRCHGLPRTTQTSLPSAIVPMCGASQRDHTEARQFCTSHAAPRALGLDVSSRTLMEHPYRVIRRMRYGRPDSSIVS